MSPSSSSAPPHGDSAIPSAEQSPPRVQLLSNGRYHVMLTADGGGSSRWNGLSVTRWHEDATRDNWGSFCYVRDAQDGRIWSTTLQPTLCPDEICETHFSLGRATYRRIVHDIEMQTEIVVSSNDDVETRRVRISNRSSVPRVLDLTSYSEVVLAPAATDAAHPAFEKLFVETEIVHELKAIVCNRRARSADEVAPSMFHLLRAALPPGDAWSCETDRARFIGRGRSAIDPQALDAEAALSGSAGSVLDPIVAIRCRIRLDPGETAVLDLVSGVADDRAKCLQLARKYQDLQTLNRVLATASIWGEKTLRAMGSCAADSVLFAELAGSMLYADASLREGPALPAGSDQNQASLWRYGISGDLPILLLQVSDASQLALARQLIQAHAFWHKVGLAAELVILVMGDEGLSAEIQRLASTPADAAANMPGLDRPGGIFVRAAAELPAADQGLLRAASRVALRGEDGLLAQQLERHRAPRQVHPAVWTVRRSDDAGSRTATDQPGPLEEDLMFPNGLGGFSSDGREYVIRIEPGKMTPAPWVNVLANASFGTLVSESGSASTWSENAQMFRLTPWSNDPVEDANTEAFYIRDEDTGSYWSPTCLPRPGAEPYGIRHGFGYSVFSHSEGGIDSELTMYVAIDAPIKFVVLRLTNRTDRVRRLSATAYVEWVLGDERAKTAMHVRTAIDPVTGALVARNPFSIDFGQQTAFFDADEISAPDTSVCGDRREFLGDGGSLRQPVAMSAARLSGAVGTGLDPCAAMRVPVTLAGGTSHEIVFRLGAGATIDEARSLISKWRGADPAREARAGVDSHWTRTLGAVQVRTPDASFDLLVNGWLPYQTLACRVWARNAFYQSSGAFGFRDQLQDVMALVHAEPTVVREHLLRCAGRQFPEGDVQHWWHPPTGRGVRTGCSDDYLWLPLATCRYVAVTGDIAVLEDEVAFLNGSTLKEGQASCYELPTSSDSAVSLYQHCVRAVEHGLRFGAHGLPLMGTGDWNDGMDLVGAAGRGESVWLGFFLCTVLTQFGQLARQRGDAQFAGRCSAESARLRAAIEHSAWDGEWYRRGWFDDGSPLGTSANAECRIDSIAQSWAVLSGIGDAERARRAMDAVDAQLVHRDTRLVQLLAPPFDHSNPSPGYIQGYVRGVRENGGQYTHAAVWAAMAFAALGDARRAWDLFTFIDPVRHADSSQTLSVYKVEPYVIASDVYALVPHAGRGGWTWYTGSAGWLLRFMLESLLGLNVEADQLRMTPCCPEHWPTFRLDYHYRETLYRIEVRQTPGIIAGTGWTLDGKPCQARAVTMIDDRKEHMVTVSLNPGPSP